MSAQSNADAHAEALSPLQRQSRDCRQSRRQSPQVEPVRCGEQSVGRAMPDSHGTALAQR
ncbi:hypothetical protein LC593_31720 [Nostoc sp. CHAB 5844]|nr:hypothetical protein [Nostoc sp. CHAB 5844]